eukprot:6190401-Pleurochrysis_carterae.AAC.5
MALSCKPFHFAVSRRADARMADTRFATEGALCTPSALVKASLRSELDEEAVLDAQTRHGV